jgi:hypothetical protein
MMLAHNKPLAITSDAMITFPVRIFFIVPMARGNRPGG